MIGRLHVLTDARAGRDALRATTLALAAGAPVVQLRVKDVTDRELYDLGNRLVGLCAEHNALCIVNDRVDIALAIGAHGTHLGADDLPVAVVRRVAGPAHLIGGTAREPAHAAKLVADGADYLGVGPAYATSTKDGLPAPLGPVGIGAVARSGFGSGHRDRRDHRRPGRGAACGRRVRRRGRVGGVRVR